MDLSPGTVISPCKLFILFAILTPICSLDSSPVAQNDNGGLLDSSPVAQNDNGGLLDSSPFRLRMTMFLRIIIC